MLSLLLAAFIAPVHAGHHAPEIRIRDISRYLEWRADGDRALYIRDRKGDWYHVALQGRCLRLPATRAIGFEPAPNGYLDRGSAVIAQGARCPVAAIHRSASPPKRARR